MNRVSPALQNYHKNHFNLFFHSFSKLHLQSKINSMHRSLFIAFFIVLAQLISSCGTTKKIESLKPEPNYSKELVYEKQVSYVNMPVEMSVADMQNQLNKFLTGLIYEDNNIEDDNLMMKVWKQAPIILNENNGKIEMALPLKIWMKVRYGFEQFGLKAYDNREINLNGIIKLTTTPVFKDWKFTTSTEKISFEWNESPTINIAGKNIPATLLINPALALFKNKIARSIDESINQSLDIKPYVFNALEQISKPVEVNKDYHVWFAMQPVELYTNRAVIANKKITLVMGMKAYVETAINSTPSLQFDKNKILLLSGEKLPDDFGVTIAGIVTYENAAALMQTNFTGKKFQSGSRSVTINKIDMWGKDGKMIVELNMSGSVNGNFYLSGVPVYDAVKKEIYISDVDFVLDSKNKLLALGDWIAHGTIANKIKENCHYSMSEQLTAAEATTKNYFNNYQPVKGVTVNGVLSSLNPTKIILTPNAIITTIEAKGKVAVSINGMQ